MSSFLSALSEQDSVVGYDSDLVAVEVAPAGDQSFAVALLELMES